MGSCAMSAAADNARIRSHDPIRRTESYVGCAGERLFLRSWVGARPARTVVFHHDLADHSGRYDRFAMWLAERETAVYAFDARGHGLSGGSRGHVTSAGDWISDLDVVLSEVGLRSPAAPIYLAGHGLGALVVLERLLRGRIAAHGGILIDVPYEADWPVEARRTARGWSVVWPRKRFHLAIDPRTRCSDDDVLRRYLEDERIDPTVSARFADACTGLRKRAFAAAENADKPLLVLRGDGALIGGGELSESSWANSSAAVVRHYPGMRHEVLQEPGRERVFADILAWLEERKSGI